MQSLQVMIVRCKRCRETEELFCSRLAATCNRAWLARANGWYVDQKKGTYCKRCTQEEVFYEEDRKQKQREAFGISGQDCHICGSCRVAASAQLRDGELDAPAPPPLFQLQADPEAAAAAGPQRTPSSSSSNDSSMNGTYELSVWSRSALASPPTQTTSSAPAAGAPASPPTQTTPTTQTGTTPAAWTPAATMPCTGWCGEMAPAGPACGCSRTYLCRAMKWTGERKKLYCPRCSAQRGYTPTPAEIQEARSNLCNICKETASRSFAETFQ